MTDRQNKMFLWALAFAARNRVGFSHLTSTETIRAQEIPLHLLLPTKDDNELLKNRMEIIVQRILKQHMTTFNECFVCDHVPHDYSCESDEKSRIVIFAFSFLFLRTVFSFIVSLFKLSEKFVDTREADFKYEAIHCFIV